ncbi:MAG: Multidrug resistance protein MdtL [Desulfovibrio sp.]
MNVFRFGRKKLIIFLAALNAFVPLSIDLYLPALPHMTEALVSSEAKAQLTLSFFMLFFALSMLVWGPLSDRLGRKKILTSGLVLYIVSSLLCALAPNMTTLIIGRVLQAIGCGAISSVSMAIVKDTFKGRIMENVLVWIQTMTILCPMVAPLLGAVLLKFTSWRGLFWLLLAAGAVGLAFSLALRETLHEKSATPPWLFATRIAFVLRDKGFRSLLLLFSITAMPFMAYLATSAFIYDSVFNVSTDAYSLFFAANAAASMLGPVAYIRIFRTAPRVPFLAVCFGVTVVCGVALLVFGSSGPFIFAGIFLPITFFGSAIRPVGAVLMMSQLDSDNGTVASLMGSCALLCGSAAMLICSLNWPSPVMALGAVCVGASATAFFLWFHVNRKKLYREP